MTRDKFMEIRDHIYGDGKNTFKYTYGHVASWLTWNRNENGGIASAPPPSVQYTQRGRYYDGPIDTWDQDNVPAEWRFSSRITTDIVFLGLNMSGDGRPPFPHAFQNARGERRIVDTFSNTAAEGAYFTDIIKPDKRFLDNVGNPAVAAEVMKIVKDRRGIMEEHIRLFKEELDFIGSAKPLLIVFGNDADWILRQGMDNYFLRKRFHAVIKIAFYNSFPRGGATRDTEKP
jgi:hypothetical protein